MILSTAVADAKSDGSAEKRGESSGGCVRRRGGRGGHPVEQELAFFDTYHYIITILYVIIYYMLYYQYICYHEP